MAYIGRTRRIRMERADKRFEAPVWRPLIHDYWLMVALVRSAVPAATVLIIPDERAN